MQLIQTRTKDVNVNMKINWTNDIKWVTEIKHRYIDDIFKIQLLLFMWNIFMWIVFACYITLYSSLFVSRISLVKHQSKDVLLNIYPPPPLKPCISIICSLKNILGLGIQHLLKTNSQCDTYKLTDTNHNVLLVKNKTLFFQNKIPKNGNL